MKYFSQNHVRRWQLNRVGVCLWLAVLAWPALGQTSRVVTGHMVPAAARLQPVASLPATNHLQLVLGLPLRNQPALAGLLQDLQDPASTNYHQWLTPEQFTEKFGPSAEDY